MSNNEIKVYTVTKKAPPRIAGIRVEHGEQIAMSVADAEHDVMQLHLKTEVPGTSEKSEQE